ncbi:MAG: DUF488 domain-containing protein [Thermoplasmata archaeon]
MKKIYTIGYQGRTFDEFVDMLLEKNVVHLVDVRSSPTSRREEFRKEELKKRLFRKSILYVHMPELGGLIEGDYREYMKEEAWKNQFRELEELAEEGVTAIMCLEKDPMRCHRRFIAERLAERGWEVIHIGKGASWKEKSLDDFVG